MELHSAAAMQGPLSGYRVLDLTSPGAAFVGRQLADLGADVVKVERPSGSPLRTIGPRIKGASNIDYGLLWAVFSASKRSLTLDIESSEGARILRLLFGEVDLVIESWTMPTRRRLAVSYHDAAAMNPKIVWTSITGFGLSGPKNDYQLTDLIALAAGGLLALWGEPDRAPTHASEPQGYYIGSAGATLASIVALYHARRTGKGQQVDVSMQEMVTMALAGYINLAVPLEGAEFSRSGPKMDFLQLKRRVVYECKDGYVVSAGMFSIDTAKLISLMRDEGCADFLVEDRWRTATTSVKLGNQWRVNQEQLETAESVLATWLRGKSGDELTQLAREHELLIFPMLDPAGLLNLPHLRERGFFHDLDLGGARVTLPGAPVTFSLTPCRHPSPPPTLGEHTDSILESIGLRNEISRLRGMKVI